MREIADLPRFDGHIDRFLAANHRFNDWTVQRACVAPRLPTVASQRPAATCPRTSTT